MHVPDLTYGYDGRAFEQGQTGVTFLKQTFHLTPRVHWDAQRSSDTYTPESFDREGFIHCTDGEAKVISVGNRYYQSDLREMVCLSIDCDRVRAPLRYEDAEHIYPHIYGPLNVDAVIGVRIVVRTGDGIFVHLGDHLSS